MGTQSPDAEVSAPWACLPWAGRMVEGRRLKIPGARKRTPGTVMPLSSSSRSWLANQAPFRDNAERAILETAAARANERGRRGRQFHICAIRGARASLSVESIAVHDTILHKKSTTPALCIYSKQMRQVTKCREFEGPVVYNKTNYLICQISPNTNHIESSAA